MTRETKVVSQRPQREQCSLAGNLCGHPDESMGMGDDDDDDDDAARRDSKVELCLFWGGAECDG